MGKRIRGILVLVMAGVSVVGTSAEVPRQVLAFYYGWYGNPEISKRWVHWGKVEVASKHIAGSTHYPVIGAYDSHDPAVVENHCRQAKQAGLTGFIVSWWAQNDFHDTGLLMMLDAAQRAGLNVTVYIETTPTRKDALRDVLYVLEKYSRHPAWLKVNGEPVLFVYSRAIEQIGLDGWQWVIAQTQHRAIFIGDQITGRAAHVFDGIHTYNITDRLAGKSVTDIQAWAEATLPEWVKIAGPERISCLTIIPGYNDSPTGRPLPRPVTRRHDGGTYRVLWEAAIAADPDWVLVTGWNEWHEGSEIEPSIENADRELKTTAEFAPKFLALKPPRR